MKKRIVIDADSLIWVIAYQFSEEIFSPEDKWIVENRCTLELKKLLMKTEATEYIGLMGGKDPVFRNKLAVTQPYKGTRVEKPEWYLTVSPIIKEYLATKYGFVYVEGIEVDDAVSMIATAHVPSPDVELVLASKDKDMLQIPGNHYNYSTGVWLQVSEDQAEVNLWEQMLKGDTSDSVQGIPGVGPKKATSILAEHPVERYPFIVLAAYHKHFGKRVGTLKFAESCNLLIMLTEGEIAPEPISNPFEKTVGQELNDDIENAD